MTVIDPNGGNPISRIEPIGPVQAYKTYGYAVRRRKATCAEVDCLNYLNGWRTMLTAVPDQDRSTLDKIYSVRVVTDDLGEGWLEFAPGQTCFIGLQPYPFCHTLPWEGHERFIVRGGDWREVTSEPVVHTRADDWVDDFANHQINLAERLDRG